MLRIRRNVKVYSLQTKSIFGNLNTDQPRILVRDNQIPKLYFSISRVRYLIEDRYTGYIPEVTTCIWTAERSEGVHIQVVTEGI